LAVRESGSSYKNIICDIASNKQVEKRELYNMAQISIIYYTMRYNKNEVTLFCRKCDPGFACHKLNPDALSAPIITDGYLYVDEEI